MELEFECTCSSRLSEPAVDGPETDVRIPCEECGSVYAVTITDLRAG